jgi:hypothetical protein
MIDVDIPAYVFTFATVTFADGSESLPSITNTGDLNTGMWFSDPDTINLSVAGSEIVEFDATSINFAANLIFPDNVGVIWGTGSDASFKWDGSKLVWSGGRFHSGHGFERVDAASVRFNIEAPIWESSSTTTATTTALKAVVVANSNNTQAWTADVGFRSIEVDPLGSGGSATGTITGAAGIYIGDGTYNATLTNQYGIYMESLTGGSNNYAIRTLGGNWSMAPTDKLYFDGLSNTYIYEESSDDLHVVVGDGIYLQIDQDLNAMGIGLANAPDGNVHLSLGGTFTGSAGSSGTTMVRVRGALTGDDASTGYITGLGLVTHISTQDDTDTIGSVSQARIEEPVITKGSSDTLTSAYTLHLVGSPHEAAGTGSINTSLMIEQSGEDEHFIAFRDSNVAHGMTTLAPTDVFALVGSYESAAGGLSVIGLKDSHGDGGKAIYLAGRLGEAVDTGDSSTSIAVIHLEASVVNAGAATQDTVVADAGNVLNISNHGTTRWLIKGNGDVHQTTDAHTALDNFNDAELVRTFEVETASAGIIKNQWDKMMVYNEQSLKDAGILGEAGVAGGLYNDSQLTRLHSGAIWQNYSRTRTVESQVEALIERLESEGSLSVEGRDEIKALVEAN